MKSNPNIHHRRSIRLKDYDYSQAGAYFVTICTYKRQCLFGHIINGKMVLNEYGQCVEYTWKDLINHNFNILLDTFAIMPNHVHGIVILQDIDNNKHTVGAGSEPAPTKKPLLFEIVRQFKTFSARRINQLRNSSGIPLWQRNYYEHIIRNEDELNKIREYIINNPLKWELDIENPERKKDYKDTTTYL
ncbi:MAG: transposase, partial [Thermodesulfovibrionales bacterium]